MGRHPFLLSLFRDQVSSAVSNVHCEARRKLAHYWRGDAIIADHRLATEVDTHPSTTNSPTKPAPYKAKPHTPQTASTCGLMLGRWYSGPPHVLCSRC